MNGMYVEVSTLTEEIDILLTDYKCCSFSFLLHTFVLGLPNKYIVVEHFRELAGLL